MLQKHFIKLLKNRLRDKGIGEEVDMVKLLEYAFIEDSATVEVRLQDTSEVFLSNVGSICNLYCFLYCSCHL